MDPGILIFFICKEYLKKKGLKLPVTFTEEPILSKESFEKQPIPSDNRNFTLKRKYFLPSVMSGFLFRYTVIHRTLRKDKNEWKLNYYVLSNIGLLEFTSPESKTCTDFIHINESIFISKLKQVNDSFIIDIIGREDERIMFKQNNEHEANKWHSELKRTKEECIKTRLQTLKF